LLISAVLRCALRKLLRFKHAMRLETGRSHDCLPSFPDMAHRQRTRPAADAAEGGAVKQPITVLLCFAACAVFLGALNVAASHTFGDGLNAAAGCALLFVGGIEAGVAALLYFMERADA
jgi:hypothetical protein